MKRTAGYIALAIGLCIGAGTAEATLIGDEVTVNHFANPPSLIVVTTSPLSTTTVKADDSDIVIAYGGFPYGYRINVRIPDESDRHSGGKATDVPAGFRPAFRCESDRHSGAIRPIG